MTNERTQDPDQLRREIAATRADMDRTLAELEDRVSPSRIRERQTAKVRSRWDGVKTSVMGSADEVNDTLDDAQQAVQQVPQELESATRGNPLAAGLIAFGIGSIAGVLAMVGKQRLGEVDLAPRRTIETLQQDKQMLSDRMSA